MGVFAVLENFANGLYGNDVLPLLSAQGLLWAWPWLR